MITYYKQDLTPVLLEKDFQVFAHGCNCFCTMGAGIAKIVKKIFPEVFAADQKTIKGSSSKLGTIDPVWIDPEHVVVNAYTQFKFWGEKSPVDYKAIESCMKSLNEFMDVNNYSWLTLPKIGAGLAGGNWDVIEKIIQKTIGKDKKVDVYYL